MSQLPLELFKYLKPMSREVFADLGFQETGDVVLSNKIRGDTTFDVVVCTTANIVEMEVRFYKYDGEVPIYDTYCGDMLEKAIQALRYAKEHHWRNFTSIIKHERRK